MGSPMQIKHTIKVFKCELSKILQEQLIHVKSGKKKIKKFQDSSKVPNKKLRLSFQIAVAGFIYLSIYLSIKAWIFIILWGEFVIINGEGDLGSF